MAYKIHLFGESLESSYGTFGELGFKLSNPNLVKQFKGWENETIGKLKKDYAKDIFFESILNSGKLMNCFPQVTFNEDFVKLYFDAIEFNE